MEIPTHYRLCHLCGTLNAQNKTPVLYCGGCCKSLSPFYYFDDRFTKIQGENELRAPRTEGEYNPIQGLTVYWENF